MTHRHRANRALLPGLIAIAVMLGGASGCEKPAAVSPRRIVVVGGDNQCGFPGRQLPEPLIVRVLGPRRRDFLGRERSGAPAVRVPVTFRVERLSEYRDDDGRESPGPATRLLPYPTLLPGPDAPPGDNPRRLEVTTDRSGLAKIWVLLGSENDDWRVEGIIYDPATLDEPEPVEREKVHFRIVSGVEKVADRTEANVGETVSLNLRLAELGDSGRLRFLEGRVVFFRIVGEPFGTSETAALSNRRDVTDTDGMRRKPSALTLGDRPGIYYVLGEVEPEEEPQEPDDGEDGAGGGEAGTPEAPGGGAPAAGGGRASNPATAENSIRGILFRIVAMDWLLLAGKIAAGTLLFLIGVRFIANGFLLILSPYLQLHLQFDSGPWTRNRALGYLSGGLAGATFQSWSTVSSHLVSFANGGLLSAPRGLTLLLGAGLGATVLPQLLSLELSFLTVPLLAAGLLCLLLPRRKGTNSWGWVLLGGGLVLASWSLINDGTELLSLSENFRRGLEPTNVEYSAGLLSYSGNVLWVLLLGLVLGFVLRTSNLLVILGIIISSHGIIGAATVVPAIIGANLGSAVLLLVRSSFKNFEARRLATAALVFHVLTALFFAFLSIVPAGGESLFLWLIEWTTPGRLFHPIPEAVGHHMAMAHTLYNLVGGLVFVCFPDVLFRCADRLLSRRTRKETVKPHDLDANLIPVPSLALRQVTQEVIYMTEMAQKAVAEAFDAFRYGEPKLSDQVVRREETIAGLQRDVARYLVLVAENQLSRHDASRLEILQTTAGTLVRIAECAERLQELTSRRLEEHVESSDETDRELSEVFDLLLTQFDNVATLLQRRDQRVEENVLKTVERLTKSRTRLETLWRQRVEHTESGAGSSVHVHMQTLIYTQAFDLLFRIAAHLAHCTQRMRVVGSMASDLD